jgi:Outer membrane efflux protein
MLLITMHDSPDALKVLADGKLAGDRAKELEQSCKQTASRRPLHIRDHRALIVDLSETLLTTRKIGDSFQQTMHCFRTACPIRESIVSEIIRKPNGAPRSVLLQCVLLLLVAGAMGAQPPTQPAPLHLTLRDAVKMALKQNPQVQIANLNIAASQENQIVVRSALLPQASFEVSETVQRDNFDAFLGMRIQGLPQHSGPFWLFQGGGNGSVPLFDLAAWHRWRQSKENTTGARAQELTVRELNVQLLVSQYLAARGETGCFHAVTEII